MGRDCWDHSKKWLTFSNFYYLNKTFYQEDAGKFFSCSTWWMLREPLWFSKQIVNFEAGQKVNKFTYHKLSYLQLLQSFHFSSKKEKFSQFTDERRSKYIGGADAKRTRSENWQPCWRCRLSFCYLKVKKSSNFICGVIEAVKLANDLTIEFMSVSTSCFCKIYMIRL